MWDGKGCKIDRMQEKGKKSKFSWISILLFPQGMIRNIKSNTWQQFEKINRTLIIHTEFWYVPKWDDSKYLKDIRNLRARWMSEAYSPLECDVMHFHATTILSEKHASSLMKAAYLASKLVNSKNGAGESFTILVTIYQPHRITSLKTKVLIFTVMRTLNLICIV